MLSLMPRDLPISNGNLMINFDHEYNIRDVYYPHVGQDNQTVGDVSFFGIWCDDKFAWISHPSWEKTLRYEDDTLATEVRAVSGLMGLELTLRDLVDFDRDLFIRRVDITNLRDVKRSIRLYTHFDPHLWGNAIGDTIFFEPEHSSLVAYKGQRYVLMNGSVGDHFGFDSFAIGAKEREGYQGTWRDAEDGNLQKNPIAQGSVDATGMIELTLNPGESRTAWIWWAFGRTYSEVSSLDALVRERGPVSFHDRTRHYWKLWVSKDASVDVSTLPPHIQQLYRRSLLIIRSQTDNGGAVIAATDSDIVQFGKDTYTYMWPRDGAIVTVAMIQAGYGEITRRFFEFCQQIITADGCVLHKYNPDGSVGSSWHPWMSVEGRRQLPIQEDETALVLWALWAHFDRFRDVEFVRPLYRPVVKTIGDFLARYREPHTRLPAASYDLWEERRGISTFTVSAVWAGLMAAVRFTEAFGELAQAEKYRSAANEIKAAAAKYLFDPKLDRFVRMLNVSREGALTADSTIDASLSGLFTFGMFEADDPRVVSTMQQIIDRLSVKTDIGGIARYENDYYFQVSKDVEQVAGNPWILCTMAVAQWHASRAQSAAELDEAIGLLDWATRRALPSGVLPEQVDPYTGKPVSVSPLTWSHASYVLAVHRVAERLNMFNTKRNSERRRGRTVAADAPSGTSGA
jgi:oligosaccharide amylase